MCTSQLTGSDALIFPPVKPGTAVEFHMSIEGWRKRGREKGRAEGGKEGGKGREGERRGGKKGGRKGKRDVSPMGFIRCILFL